MSIDKRLPMQDDDSRLSWFPIIAVGLSMVSFIMIKTGRDAVFFHAWGISRLPLAYVWIALAAIPAAMIHLYAMSRWGARKTRTGLFLVTALCYLGFVPVTDTQHTVIMTVMFITVPVIFAAVFAGAWLLAGDLLDGAEPSLLRVVYSRIGAASTIGGILGGLLAQVVSLVAEPRWLVASGSLVLVLVAALVAKAHRDNPLSKYTRVNAATPTEDSHKTYAKTQSLLIRQTYVKLLIGISGLATIAALFIDFQFYALATLTKNNSVQFFATFYIVLNVMALVVQVFISPKLQKKLGVVGVLLLLPTALLGGAGLFSFWTIIHARTVLRVMEGGLKASMHRSMWEQIYLPIERRSRDAAKTVVDGLTQRLAEGLAALLILLWFWLADSPVETLNFDWMSWAIVVTLVFWILLTRRLGKFGCSDLDPSEPLIRLPDS